MKKVLITGGAGFIAHHLIGHILKNTDWEIVTLDRLDYSGNLNRLHDLMIPFMPETKRRVKIVHHIGKTILCLLRFRLDANELCFGLSNSHWF